MTEEEGKPEQLYRMFSTPFTHYMSWNVTYKVHGGFLCLTCLIIIRRMYIDASRAEWMDLKQVMSG